MNWIHNLKAGVFHYIVVGMTKVGLTANILSVGGGVIALAALFMALYTNEGLWFVWGIWLQILLDGFDGTLARYQKKFSNFGSFVDVVFDHVGIVTASIFIYYFGFVDFIPLLLYTLFYTLVVVFAFILGEIGRPYKFVFRPRLLMYAALTYDFIWQANISNPLLYLFSAILFISLLEGIFKLGKFLK